jgi:transposase InsO family protein
MIRRQYLTYVATDEGWLYLAAVKDMATREIVDWSMADHLKEFVVRERADDGNPASRAASRPHPPFRPRRPRRIQAVVATP